MTVYGYIRGSTDKQDCENQKLGIERKVHALGLNIDKYIEDAGVSGTKEPDARALGGILRKIKSDDVIICSELSRLGRKLFMIMRILEQCMQKGAKVYTVKDNYELGDNIQSKVLAFAFGLSAEIERDLISQRTKEALANCRQRGKILGRPKGSKTQQNKLANNKYIIQKMLNDNISRVKIARKFKVSLPTLRCFITNISSEK